MAEPARTPSLVLVADTGGDLYHVGDEAMLVANVERLIARGCEVRVVGRVPADDGETRSALALAARRFASDPGAPPPDFIDRALDGADGLFVSGGGNLASTWPDLLWQRVHLLRAARRRGLPVVTGGQTIGPALDFAERRALADALAEVRQLGVREQSSRLQALELGVPEERICVQADDAFLLGGIAVHGLAEGPFVAVSFDPGSAPTDDPSALDALATQLADIAGSHRLRVTLVPHVGTLGSIDDGDGPIGVALRDRLRTAGIDATALPVLGARETVWVTQRASAVVSSRYHALVFASAAAVPCLAVSNDAYTRVKLTGALAHVGMDSWCLSADRARGGGLTEAFARLWRARDAIRDRMSRDRAGVERSEERRWQRLISPWSALPAPAVAARSTIAIRQRRLGDVEWADYARDEFLRLGPILDRDDVEALRRRADELATGRVINPAIRVQPDTGGEYEALPGADPQSAARGLLYRKVQGLETDPVFAPLVAHPIFLEICDHQYGPHVPVAIFRAMIMNKPAGQGTELPWHQDGGNVWALDRDPLVTVWVALDSATRSNGCLEVIPGSHRLGLLSRFGSTLSPRDAARHAPVERALSLELEAGQGLLLHNWLIHRSGVNPSAAPRRAFTACYMDGRTRSTLTGQPFAMVAGTLCAEVPPYLLRLRHDAEAHRASFREAERYALSLRDEVERLRRARESAECYAKSLEAERSRRKR